MADNRNFVNKFANQGGGDIFVEDAKLSEISTKTAIASEGVMLKGTDGAYYEIDKASLSEVIRAELGAILADNSKNNGTSVGKVPTLNSSGNALGASSVADLASVLGVSLANNTNPDTISAMGTYTGNFGATLGNGVLRVMGTGGFRTQLFINYTTTLSRRNENPNDFTTWGDWQRCDNFGCSTPSALAELLGGSIPKFYGNNGISQGMPANYGFLQEIKCDGYNLHLYVSLKMDNVPDKFWARFQFNSETPTSWVSVSLT